jgi:hypothetical protein
VVCIHLRINSVTVALQFTFGTDPTRADTICREGTSLLYTRAEGVISAMGVLVYGMQILWVIHADRLMNV